MNRKAREIHSSPRLTRELLMKDLYSERPSRFGLLGALVSALLLAAVTLAWQRWEVMVKLLP